MKIKIMLPDKDGKPVSVFTSGVKLGKFFALHRDIRWARNSKGKTINRIVVMRSGWTITHLPTGYAALNRIKRRKQAMYVAQRLAGIKEINWKLTKPEAFREQAAKLPTEVISYVSKLKRTVSA